MTETSKYSDIARAKINLTLHVGPVQDNGYHPLHSLVVFADIGDRLDGQMADDFGLKIKGPFAKHTPGGDENLILEAVKTVAKHNDIQARLAYTLTKKLPVASGIGGGSADAAAALRLLAQAEHISWSEHAEDFLPLGADVPVCFLSRTCVMEGMGEQILPWPGLGQIPAILVNPGVGVNTAEVFASFDNVGMSSDFTLPAGSLLHMAKAGRNDLQGVATRLQPVIETVVEAISRQENCQLARMSGSGATCFGLFSNQSQAEKAAKNIRRDYPDWWCISTLLGDAA
ncbi:MAG: 4-(cytidine 5'-diphospho)-2-C-methyl-D-erythritol kinase [Robiginitomaculum sp.]|nr:MAG: 4-(cytidine 5'-diphospho)-2-C-methyl-D-erythritol kinase [Robiginitomaculum sp.]